MLEKRKRERLAREAKNNGGRPSRNCVDCKTMMVYHKGDRCKYCQTLETEKQQARDRLEKYKAAMALVPKRY